MSLEETQKTQQIMSGEQPQLLSKIASGDGHGEHSPYFDGWKAYENDPFHPTNNLNGVIQMGLAENQVYIYIWNLSESHSSVLTLT